MRTTLLFCFYLFTFVAALAQHPVRYELPNFSYDRRVGIMIGYPEDVATDSYGDIYYATHLNVRKLNSKGFLYDAYTAKGLPDEAYSEVKHITVDKEDYLYVVSSSYSKIYKFNRQGESLMEFGSHGAGPGQFSNPAEIAVNAEGEIYVADYGNKRIQKFDAQGNLQQVLPIYSYSFDFDDAGNLYALDQFEKKVVKYSPEGVKLTEFGNTGLSLELNYKPSRLTIDRKKNHVIITDSGTYGSVYVYDTEGTFIRRIYQDYGWGDLRGSTLGVTTDRDGNILVADKRHNGDGRIVIFSPEGNFLRRFGYVWNTKDMVLDDDGNVYQIDNSYNYVHKYNAAGEQVLQFGVNGSTIPGAPKAITIDFEGNIYVLSSHSWYTTYTGIHKFDKEGNLLQVFRDFGPGLSYYFNDIAVDPAGDIYLSEFGTYAIRKISSKGNFIGVIAGSGKESGKVWAPQAIAVDPLGFLFVLDHTGGRVQKFDRNGKFIELHGWNPPGLNEENNSDLAIDGKGNLYILSALAPRRFMILNNDGDIIYQNNEMNITKVAVDRKGSRLVYKDYTAQGYVQYLATNYTAPLSMISGKAFIDANQNCVKDNDEQPLANMVIEATPGPHYTVTDDQGRYTLPIDTGTYVLRMVPFDAIGRQFHSSCLPQQVKVQGPGTHPKTVDFGSSVTLSPHLSVSASSTRRRRCFESTTTVRYTNSGFATAPDARVYVKLPAEVGLLSADKAYTRLPDGTYEFAVGDLAAGQRGTITIEDIVTCGDESVRGRTVCTRAWMTPSNNKPTQPKPTITITGRCDSQSGRIRFVLRNTGTADMEQHEQFRKFSNGELSSIEQFRLAAGDSMVLWVPSMGYTWRLEADQPDGNGDNITASVTIEACTAANAGTTVSSGLVNLMPTDDEEAEVSEECMMITDSYDPNDKLVTPVGRTSEYYTPTNTTLKYKIRFQNTGTDVAYRVVVVDTLSEHLDLSTLQVGAASHASRFEVSGKGQPVLTWTFDNIMLPDSTADEPGSHGYIQFSIKPKADLPEKTAVGNFADIFFDYNTPIRTNVTVNRIYDIPPVVNEAVRVNLEDVLATPAIAAFEPAAGMFGVEVKIAGKRFAAIATDNKVYLNGKAATVISATSSELRVLVPAGATTGALKVITPDGGITASETFEVYQPPVLNSFSPAEGMVGQTVTLEGQHLQPELFEGIKLGDLGCEIINHSGNSITVQVPAGATTGTFEISTKGGEAASTSSYVVWYRPAISSLSKETGIVGASITITGENFSADKARNKVLFGQIEAQVLEANPQHLVVLVPEQAASGFITVETPGGQAATVFKVIPGPKFTAMQPARGSVGTVVEISGWHFGIMGLQDRIVFNGQEALVLEASGDRYKVRVPRGATTGKVQITGYGGKAYSTADFVVEELKPAEAVQVYPNPNSGRFILSLQHADFEVQSVEIFDGIGRLIHTTTVDGPRPEKLELQIRSKKPGLYTLHVKSERGMIIKKITLL